MQKLSLCVRTATQTCHHSMITSHAERGIEATAQRVFMTRRKIMLTVHDSADRRVFLSACHITLPLWVTATERSCQHLKTKQSEEEGHIFSSGWNSQTARWKFMFSPAHMGDRMHVGYHLLHRASILRHVQVQVSVSGKGDIWLKSTSHTPAWKPKQLVEHDSVYKKNQQF